MTRVIRLLLLLGVAVVVIWAAARLARPPALPGFWRDQSPAALLYNFRYDGSVWLARGEAFVPVFRYQIGDGDRLTLYDGMGRRRELRFELAGDRLVLRDRADPSDVFGEFRRER